jgi:ectoine hydroxylase-related dioxygenase (phytanoyl-CoA dioxygenase family)
MIDEQVDGKRLAAELERVGYAELGMLLDDREVGEIRSEFDRLLVDTPFGRNEFEGDHTQRIYALFAKTRGLDVVATHPLVLGLLDGVLGAYQLSAPVAIAIGPGAAAQPLHRDEGLYPVARPHPQLVCSVMWAIDEFTDVNGGTRLIPASHGASDAEPSDQDAISISMPAGAAIMYVGSLWHGGGANRTDRVRRGVVMHYAASWLRPAENHCLAVPREVVKTLSPRLQELLGYNVHPPFLGNVDGRHPQRLLD